MKATEKMIDLRSDILGRPTPEMIDAMVKAASDSFTYGFREDPITTRLERLAADLLGKEDALFLPTATMANQIAVHIQCSPGQELVAESRSHIFMLEAGGTSAISGVMSRPILGEMGVMDLAEMEKAISLGTDQRSKTGLIWVENTHNGAGGTVVSEDQMEAIYSTATRYHIPVHLDGARLFNAAVYLGIPASKLTRYTDTAAVNLNKGLCAPLGAVLVGSQAFIKEAGRVRLMLGGGWRPTGILAAAAIVALEKMIDRLVEDHMNARRIAEGISACPGISVNLGAVHTNLVFFQIVQPSLSLEEFVERLKAHNILVNPAGPDRLRIAVHREIGEEEANQTIRAFHRILGDEPRL